MDKMDTRKKQTTEKPTWLFGYKIQKTKVYEQAVLVSFNANGNNRQKDMMFKDLFMLYDE